jgi:hypothetical protein
MKRIALILSSMALAATVAGAAFEDWQVGIRANAMAGAYTAIADDIEAVRWNPAGLSGLQGWQAQVFGKRLWNIKGLVNGTGSLARSWGRWGGAGVSLQQVGCDWEKDQALTLAHGFAMNRQLSFGWGVNLYRLWQERFGSASTAGFDIGLLARVYRKWSIGIHGHNLNHPSLGTLYQYDLPSWVSAGVGFQPFPGLMGTAEAAKEPSRITRYKFGSEFSLAQDRLKLRAGILNEGQLTLYTMGFGVKSLGVSVNYAFEGGHEALSGTHQFGLGYSWGGK